MQLFIRCLFAFVVFNSHCDRALLQGQRILVNAGVRGQPQSSSAPSFYQIGLQDGNNVSTLSAIYLTDCV